MDIFNYPQTMMELLLEQTIKNKNEEIFLQSQNHFYEDK